MKHRQFLPVFSAYLLIILLFLRFDFLVKESSRNDSLNVFVGVDAAYGDVEGVKRLVDEVKSYTNLFVIGSTGITFNRTKLDEACQHIYDSGLYFLLFTHPTTDFSQAQWIEGARQRWRDRFLGLYAYDEPGGHQIDRSHPYMLVKEAENYTDAANKYVGLLDEHLKKNFTEYMRVDDFPLFTSDYVLYWFDYRAGYDVLFAEFGWNYSRQLNVELCRGAATAQNKDWGVMITWTYNDPPYIESGEELYDDMILAYNNGAKYVVVFNYPKITQYGILTEEHFDAIKKFWNYIYTMSERHGNIKGEVAYVLPQGYGFGFRSANDNIWGLWKADESSKKIWGDVNNLLDTYGSRLDIVYSAPEFSNAIKSRYDKLIFWNETGA